MTALGDPPIMAAAAIIAVARCGVFIGVGLVCGFWTSRLLLP